MSTALQPFDAAKALLNDPAFKEQIRMALPAHMTADRMTRIALTACLGQPKLLEVCSHAAGKASLAKELLKASQLGVEVDGRQAHLVPFNDKKLGMIVQLIVGYQGLVDKAYNHPKVKSIWWNVVHEKDEFRFVDGLDRKLEHIKYDGDEEPGALRYAYAVCEMDGGSRTFVCLNKREVMAAKKCSRGADSAYSPWTTHEAAMWSKTAVRALCKQIPQSNELRDALKVDDESGELEEQRFRNAKPVFSAPKLFGAGSEPSPTAAPVPETPQDGHLATLLEKMTTRGITEPQMIQFMRDTNMADESLSSLKEIHQVSPAAIEAAVKAFDKSIAPKLAPTPKK